MPELPEVETIRKSLQNNLIGKTITKINVLEPKQFIGNPEKILNKTLSDVLRWGKVLSLKTSNNLYINIHLKMSGQLLYLPDSTKSILSNPLPRTGETTLPSPHTRVIFEFTDGSALFFQDLRKFGWVKLSDKLEGPKGFDVLSSDFNLPYIEKVIKNSRKPIKVFLLDQDFIAGIGNIYANDSLWEAKINPLRKANSLTTMEIEQLYNGIKQIIDEGVKYRGSSAKDEMYILPDNTKGGYQHHMKVYHRTGQPCLRCQTSIVWVKQSGRSTFYCPTCQA